MNNTGTKDKINNKTPTGTCVTKRLNAQINAVTNFTQNTLVKPTGITIIILLLGQFTQL